MTNVVFGVVSVWYPGQIMFNSSILRQSLVTEFINTQLLIYNSSMITNSQYSKYLCKKIIN